MYVLKANRSSNAVRADAGFILSCYKKDFSNWKKSTQYGIQTITGYRKSGSLRESIAISFDPNRHYLRVDVKVGGDTVSGIGPNIPSVVRSFYSALGTLVEENSLSSPLVHRDIASIIHTLVVKNGTLNPN